MPHKLTRINRVLTPAERKRVEQTRRETAQERDAIIARGRAAKQRYLEESVALRETLKLLREERVAQGMTLQQVQDQTGIGRGALSRLENDPEPNPTLHTLQRYAAALGRRIVVRLSE